MNPWDWQNLNLVLALNRLSRMGLAGLLFFTLIGAGMSFRDGIQSLRPPKARDYVEQGNLDQAAYGQKFHSALQNYNQAIKLEPQYAEAYAERGNLYMKWSSYLDRASKNKYTRKRAQELDYDLSKSPAMKNAALADYRQAKAILERQGGKNRYYTEIMELEEGIRNNQQGKPADVSFP